jgi:hypothetical protein
MNHEVYKPIDTTEPIAPCPLCYAKAMMWQYSEAPDDPVSRVVMCENGDAIGLRSGITNEGCPFYMPPADFYRATAREAARYWNAFAEALRIQRFEREPS